MPTLSRMVPPHACHWLLDCLVATTTTSRAQLQERAELYESASSAKKARKLVKLLIEVEKGLNSAEAAEIASQSDPVLAAKYMKDAGLRFLPRPPPPPSVVAKPSPSEDKDGAPPTPAGGDNGDNKGDGGTPTQKKAAKAATPRSREEKPPSSSSRNPGSGRTERAAGKTAAKRRRSSSSSSSDAGRRGASTQSSSSGGGGQKRKRKTKKRGGNEGVVEAAAATEKPLEAFVVTAAGCEVRCLLMLDEQEGEGREGGRLVVAVGDALTGEALLESLIEEPAVVQLASHGLMREVAYVNRVAFQVSCRLRALVLGCVYFFSVVHIRVCLGVVCGLCAHCLRGSTECGARANACCDPGLKSRRSLEPSSLVTTQ